ncbi:MAG: transporter substrate-binding protein [Herbinix sp.]|jgi:hypothetical protein|nr:transporter substrate-binding protein [Herbinix sp.]
MKKLIWKKLIWKKLISTLLLVTLLITISGCKKNTEIITDHDDGEAKQNMITPVEEPESPFAKYTENEEVVDLQGYEFKVVDFHDNRWAPEEIKSPMDELIVSIIEDVEKTYNCSIVFEHVNPDLIFETAQPAIMAGDKYADLIGTTMWAFGKLLGGNLIGKINDVETMDINQSYYFEEVTQSATFGKDTYAFGAPFGTHIGNYWLVFYNTRIWNELGYPDPYELVRNGQWTWDKFVEYAKGALRDNDGDGIISTDADRWGVTCAGGDSIQAFFFGMGGKYYQLNEEGKVRLACLDQASIEKMNFMYKLYNKDNIIFKNQNIGGTDMFAAGKALFMCNGNDANDTMKNMEDDFGILPTPKWNTEEEQYINAPDHNAPVFCITNTNPNLYEAGIIIEALAKRYQAVEDQNIQDFTDTFWRMEEDAEMMAEYIKGNGAYDIINMIKNANSQFNAPASILFSACYDNAYSDIKSTMEATEDALNVLLDDFFDNIEDN